MNSPPNHDQRLRWWGEYTLDDRQCCCLEFDGLALYIRNEPGEWQFFCFRYEESDEARSNLLFLPHESVPEGGDLQRFIVNSKSRSFKLLPIMADRPVVFRPRAPFYLLNGESTTIYVSCAIWIKAVLIMEDGTEKLLGVIPSRILSDTWMGPNNMQGELCYASRTTGRIDINLLKKRPNRAIAPVYIDNQADTPLLLERFSLPAPLLAVYESKDDRLWTNPVTLRRYQDNNVEVLSIDPQAPKQAIHADLITEAAHKADKHRITKALGHLFG